MQNVYTVMQIINAAKCRRCGVDKCSFQTFQYTDPSISAGPPNPKNTATSSWAFSDWIPLTLLEVVVSFFCEVLE